MARVIEGLRAIALTQVMVGVPAEKDSREGGQPINNAALAYIHTNGAPEAGIPARPWLEPGIRDIQPEIVRRQEGVLKLALDGRPDAVDRAQNALGLRAVSSVKARLKAGPHVPLKESTLAARRRRGRTGTKPLIDTGQLLNANTYVIRGR